MLSSHRLPVVLNHLKRHFSTSVKLTSTLKYKYTLNNNLLTEEQRQFYEDNGYIIIRNLVDHKLLDECIERFIDVCNGKIASGSIMLLREKSLINTSANGETLINKAQNLMRDKVFSKYSTNSLILDYVECFTGPNMCVLNSMFINKPPGVDKLTGTHPIHQDLNYGPVRPAERIVAIWTAMEKVNIENGCLFVLPGTHKSVLQPHQYPEHEVNSMFHTISGFDLIPKHYLEMEKGDTVFFHPLLMHGSGPNTTKNFRKAITCFYASNDCHYIDVTGTIQENTGKEYVEIVKKISGKTITFQDFIRIRQKVVRGKPGRMQLSD